jgi:hypothetical protein
MSMPDLRGLNTRPVTPPRSQSKNRTPDHAFMPFNDI